MKKSANIMTGGTHRERSSAPQATALRACLRRLKWDEVVTRGDLIGDELRGFEPWEGPTGFRADAFVMPIYRRAKAAAGAIKKK